MRQKTLPSLLLGALALLAVPATADAQGRASARTDSVWAGGYAGISVGWARGGADFKSVTEIDPILSPPPLGYASFGAHDSGALVGFQSGYNWHRGSYVFGYESDFQHVGITASKNFTNSIFGFPGTAGGLDTRTRVELDNVSTLRGRIGMVHGNWLIYATGGLAWGEISTSLSFPPTGGGTNSFNADDSKWQVGYAVGAGTEIKLSRGASLKFEYLYVDLGDKTHRFDIAVPAGTDHYSWKQEMDIHVIRAGLNFKLSELGLGLW